MIAIHGEEGTRGQRTAEGGEVKSRGDSMQYGVSTPYRLKSLA